MPIRSVLYKASKEEEVSYLDTFNTESPIARSLPESEMFKTLTQGRSRSTATLEKRELLVLIYGNIY
jgi:hypothetical protein